MLRSRDLSARNVEVADEEDTAQQDERGKVTVEAVLKFRIFSAAPLSMCNGRSDDGES